MLTVTEDARAHMAQMLAEAEVEDDTALRFVRTERGFAPELDNAGPGDTTFDHEGRTVLVLDEQVSELLTDRTLGLRDTDEGPRLAFL